MTWFSWNSLITFLLLVGFELVLGVDNVLVISLVVAPLSSEMRQRARVVGLLLALLFRLLFVAGAFWVVQSRTPFVSHFSAREIVLILGGFFLVGKGAHELYGLIEIPEKKPQISSSKKHLSGVVMQIVLLDLIFSLDSVITAVGLTSYLYIIFSAVIFSFIALLFYIGPVGEFILRYRSLKITALLFLVLLGTSFVAEGVGYCIDKKIFYGIFAFSIIIALLQERDRKNNLTKRQKRRPNDKSHPTLLSKPSDRI